MDAALYLPPVRGLLPADDPRTLATLRACTKNVTRDHYAYRFRHEERPLEEAEGVFLLCGAAALYSEEYDIAQRQLRGSLPQAFVHALMLDTAATLAPDTPA
ncbi:hypothetical protein [Streptomyces mirabilis]|uniref:hypothetical protein n=1 Tax=Streptomyces mirabilis TaxID=68239 RepID=UPI0033B7BB28